jgi:hypothetical protein
MMVIQQLGITIGALFFNAKIAQSRQSLKRPVTHTGGRVLVFAAPGLHQISKVGSGSI